MILQLAINWTYLSYLTVFTEGFLIFVSMKCSLNLNMIFCSCKYLYKQICLLFASKFIQSFLIVLTW